MDHSLPGSSVHGISLARILEWVAISSSRESSQNPGIEPVSPALAGGFFTAELSGKPINIPTPVITYKKYIKDYKFTTKNSFSKKQNIKSVLNELDNLPLDIHDHP